MRVKFVSVEKLSEKKNEIIIRQLQIKMYSKQIVIKGVVLDSKYFRESSFNMTRGDEDIEGGLRKFVYIKTNIREGGGLVSKKMNR